MAHIWYDGNLNQKVNERQKSGITYYVRGTKHIEEHIYERYAVQTHFIKEGEDYITLLKRYVMPLYQAGDVLSISEKVIAMCQKQTVPKDHIQLGFFAKMLSMFATRTKSGIGMDEPYKLQLVINIKGLPLVLWASFLSALGRLFHKRGIFYKILGPEIAGIDGLYAHSAFEVYHDLAVLVPREPGKVCDEIFRQCQCSCMIVDANDISADIYGCSRDLMGREKELLGAIEDNPAGQDDELTPFVLIRELNGTEPENYVPISGRAV